MIDSSGVRTLRANGTILDFLPVGKVILICGGILIALFSVIKPEASNGLDFFGRLVFWTLHVGIGLAALWIGSLILANGKFLPDSTLAAVIVTGLAGAAIALPGYLILDAVYLPHIIDNDLDEPANSFFGLLVTEFLDLAPWFLLAWLIINLPVLLPANRLEITMSDDQVIDTESSHAESKPSAVDSKPVSINASEEVNNGYSPIASNEHDTADKPALGVTDNVEADLRDIAKPNRAFLSTLPGFMGTDIIAVSSDLHYLNVWTSAGRTTVLGSLRNVVCELGESGLLVHRSHWIAHAHVRRIVGAGNDAAIIMSNELRVPVSRRRWKMVREHYGKGVIQHNQ